MHANVLVIGAGMAGYSMLRELAKYNTDDVVMLTADSGDYYNKPQLSMAMRDKKQISDLILADGSDAASKHEARLLSSESAISINLDNKSVQTEKRQITFNHLVLATGSTALGAQYSTENVYSINSLEEYDHFRGEADLSDVAIIGDGLVATELASDLIASGHKATLFAPTGCLLPNLLPKELGLKLAQDLEQAGLAINKKLITNIKNNRIGWTKYSAVIVAIGLKPNTTLAETANLKIDNGIITDEFGSCAPNVYALGDCAAIGSWRPYIQPINIAAKAIASTINGEAKTVTYPIMPVIVKSHPYPVIVVPANGDWHVHEDGLGADCIKDGKLVGFAQLGPNSRKAIIRTKEIEQD